jgi:cytochrome c
LRRYAVGSSDRSRHSGAPPFRDISDAYPVGDLSGSLVEGLMTGHPDVPEFQFTPEAANDFIAYLQSIQEAVAQRIKPGT